MILTTIEMKYRLLAIIFFLIITSAFFCSSVYAQSDILPSVSLSPAVFEFDVAGGEVISRTIKITNHSAVALPIKVKVVNFEAADETGGMKFVTEVEEEELAAYRWLTIAPADFIIEPQATREINLTVNIPREAVPGGHYVAILFEPQLPSWYFSKQATKLVPVVGTLVLFSVQKWSLNNFMTASPLVITDFNLTDKGRVRTEALVLGINRLLAWLQINQALAASDFLVYQSVPREVVLRLKNNSIFHIKPSGRLAVFNIFGKQVAEADLERTTILPQKVRRIPLTLNWQSQAGFLPAAYGRYRVIFTAQVGDKAVTADIYFWVIPWVFMLSTSLAFGLLIYFVLKYRRRLLISFKILIGKN